MREATGLPEISFLGAMPKRTWPSFFAFATTSSNPIAIPLAGKLGIMATPRKIETIHFPNRGRVVGSAGMVCPPQDRFFGYRIFRRHRALRALLHREDQVNA
jgi:hypothetical protein